MNREGTLSALCAFSALLCFSSAGIHAFQWDDGFPDGKEIITCLGNSTVFNWSFSSVNPDTHRINISWSFQPSPLNVSAANSTAANSTENTTVLDTAAQPSRYVFAPENPTSTNAGLALKSARLNDSGVYSVTVTTTSLQAPANVTSHTRHAKLFVYASPTTSDGLLVINEPQAVRVSDGDSEVWRLKLSCGRFTYLGYPEEEVVWSTPDHPYLTGTHCLTSGYFCLLISSPPVEGEYSCQIKPKNVRLGLPCTDYNSPLRHRAHIMLTNTDIDRILHAAIAGNGSQTGPNEQEETSLDEQAPSVESTLQHLQEQISNLSAGQGELETRDDSFSAELSSFTEQLSRLREGQRELGNRDRNFSASLVSYSQTLSRVSARLTRVEGQTEECPAWRSFVTGRDCQDIQQCDAETGPQVLTFGAVQALRVFCDQRTDGGGWTVIQRRLDGSVNFTRTWTQYERGFGSYRGEYWLGLHNIYLLTASGNYSLRVDLTNSDTNAKTYAVYSTFFIEGPDNNYTLHVRGYNGTAGDALNFGVRNFAQNGKPFSTPDHRHVMWSGNTVDTCNSGWWFSGYTFANLNGVYGGGLTNGCGRLVWSTTALNFDAYKTVEMKIRLRN